MSSFFRFPHTLHLAWLAKRSSRDNKALSPAEARESIPGEEVLEEKLDGANLGFPVRRDGCIRGQTRGQFLQKPYRGRFARLPAWIERRAGLLALPPLRTEGNIDMEALKRIIEDDGGSSPRSRWEGLSSVEKAGNGSWATPTLSVLTPLRPSPGIGRNA